MKYALVNTDGSFFVSHKNAINVGSFKDAFTTDDRSQIERIKKEVDTSYFSKFYIFEIDSYPLYAKNNVRFVKNENQ